MFKYLLNYILFNGMLSSFGSISCELELEFESA